ncbi:hypothetical protein TrST_g2657 [Triparma strigata]|uniref:Uncharacterized protein n=1 Tax=Triparma strigata TaxID=1606541 RepID=A0A9W7BK01_9STRA|nr:hypothetical protein TrST_g2657 [Triparma strigata]
MATVGSKSEDAAIGMMDGAYFTSRAAVLSWVNSLLSLNLKKIEQTCTGAVACQVIEYMYPGTVNLKRVNWEARNDYEYVSNWKLVQNSFNTNKISRHIDVDKLVRGKYQDNLEFMQWMKAFFDQKNVVRESYDPVAVRSRGKGGSNAAESLGKIKGTTKLLPNDRDKAKAEALAASSVDPPVKKSAPPKKKKLPLTEKTNSSSEPPSNSTPTKPLVRSQSSRSSRSAPKPSPRKLDKKLKNLSQENYALKAAVEGLERERDFYFDKLRRVEVIMERLKGEGVEVGEVFEVLYQTSEGEEVEGGEEVGGVELKEGGEAVTA